MCIVVICVIVWLITEWEWQWIIQEEQSKQALSVADIEETIYEYFSADFPVKFETWRERSKK